MDLVLIRHPAVDVPPGVCYGQTDLPLLTDVTSPVTTRGATDDAANGDLTSIAAHLRGRGAIRACFASPLRRCADVAHALASPIAQPGSNALGQPLVTATPVIDARLAEIDFGLWEMQRWDDIPRDQIDLWATDVLHARPHRGESAYAVAERCASWLRDLSLQIDSAVATVHSSADDDVPPPCMLVIGHAGPIRLLTALALGLPLTATLQWPLNFGGVVTLRHDTPSQDTAMDASSRLPERDACSDAEPPLSTSRPSGTWTLRQWNG